VKVLFVFPEDDPLHVRLDANDRPTLPLPVRGARSLAATIGTLRRGVPPSL
jgi:hypothetical protein